MLVLMVTFHGRLLILPLVSINSTLQLEVIILIFILRWLFKLNIYTWAAQIQVLVDIQSILLMGIPILIITSPMNEYLPLHRMLLTMYLRNGLTMDGYGKMKLDFELMKSVKG